MINQEILKNIIYYDPETGSISRLKNGNVITTLDKKGYIVLKIKGKMYFGHRLAFLYMTGEIPIEVDHANNIRNDNRWCNLRAANRNFNSRNSVIPQTNTSGYKGVHWHIRKKRWIASIRLNGKKVHLGAFKELEKAASAYEEAAFKYYGEFANVSSTK